MIPNNIYFSLYIKQERIKFSYLRKKLTFYEKKNVYLFIMNVQKNNTVKISVEK